jgi:hypothetical protein
LGRRTLTDHHGGPKRLTAIKAAHTLAWLSIESCMLYVLYAGLKQRSDRRAAIAAAVVAGESLIFAANGFRCPLTDLAEQRGGAEVNAIAAWCGVGAGTTACGYDDLMPRFR